MVNGGICLAWHFGTIYCHVELKVIVHVVLYVLYVLIWEFPSGLIKYPSIYLSIYLSSLKAEVVTPDHTCSKTADTGEGTTLYREERVYSMYIQ